jgi:hypothetical protein
MMWNTAEEWNHPSMFAFGVAGLHPRCPRHFAQRPSESVSQTYCPPTLVTSLQLLRK